MSGALPHFWAQPFRYIRWSAREKPAYFYSCVIAGLGPVFLTVVPPVRKYFGDVNPAPIPVTYPIPTGPRKQLTGFGDDTEEA
ncbi:hypothetical protein SMACR_01349 [Sordaria macrospora]|uniref:NADH-ubiquinone oxidoreductase 9.5 kDa subunit n=1 Tax=Sordaria macrospora TaxID=5147 RepID=A0A8S8ZW37_SORMA|nr:hypothetical protein SMACR_01349 [Sordaria macrospora]KAH7634435.1 NADH:ubiquinone reductase 9.5 kda ubiquinone-binding protein [Sordaria sp. MPI-SDFR-AT-0083]WPJ58769.1 hypothetical protein SMAC4_01349 [Sordaria macrospora]